MEKKVLIISAYFFPEQFKSTDLARTLKKKKNECYCPNRIA